MSKNNKGFASIALIGVIIVVAAAAYLLFFKESCVLESSPDLYVCESNFSHFMNSFRKSAPVNPAQIPDTSGVSNNPSPAATSTLSVQFPKLSSNSIYSTNVSYYLSQDWKMTIEDKPFTCIEQSKTVPGQEQVVKKIINGNTYCIYSNGSGAAGTSYADYQYVSERYGKLITISFTLGLPNCANYLDEPYKSECNNAQIKLNLDSIIDQTFATIK